MTPRADELEMFLETLPKTLGDMVTEACKEAIRAAEEQARAEEREACAKAAENHRGKTCDMYNPIPKEISGAIRSRGRAAEGGGK